VWEIVFEEENTLCMFCSEAPRNLQTELYR